MRSNNRKSRAEVYKEKKVWTLKGTRGEQPTLRCVRIWAKQRSGVWFAMWGSRTVSDEDPSEPSFSTSLLNFSSGNPRIEETRGLMHLFSDDTPSSLPVTSSLRFSFLFDVFSSSSSSLNELSFPFFCVCVLLGWKETTRVCCWSAESHDLCGFLPVLWFLHSAYPRDAHC